MQKIVVDTNVMVLTFIKKSIKIEKEMIIGRISMLNSHQKYGKIYIMLKFVLHYF
jgi:hypothetical protein